MNYLVTGAAGFIGAAVAEKLLAQGHSCTTIDNLSTGRREHVPAGCRFIYGDVSNPILKTVCVVKSMMQLYILQDKVLGK